MKKKKESEKQNEMIMNKPTNNAQKSKPKRIDFEQNNNGQDAGNEQENEQNKE